MEHKAFIFNYEQFRRELLPLLWDALATDECNRLIAFVRQNIKSLTDPYAGEPLGGNWEDLVETADAHQYGDFALTKYYDPSDDVGLGASWQAIQELVHGDRNISPILGSVVGPPDNSFDPGKMGAYFQNNDQVKESLEYLQQLSQQKCSKEVGAAVELLEHTFRSQKGLYITF